MLSLTVVTVWGMSVMHTIVAVDNKYTPLPKDFPSIRREKYVYNYNRNHDYGWVTCIQCLSTLCQALPSILYVRSLI